MRASRAGAIYDLLAKVPRTAKGWFVVARDPGLQDAEHRRVAGLTPTSSS